MQKLLRGTMFSPQTYFLIPVVKIIQEIVSWFNRNFIFGTILALLTYSLRVALAPWKLAMNKWSSSYWCNSSPGYHVLWKNRKLKSDKVKLRCPASIYLLKVSNRSTRKRCDMCSKLKIKTPERRQWCHSGVFIDSFEHILHHFQVFLLLTLSK